MLGATVWTCRIRVGTRRREQESVPIEAATKPFWVLNR
jgi:hypothetical protein